MDQIQPGTISDDGQWWWDGWQWVPRYAPIQVPLGARSDDGRYVWDGRQWVPVAVPVAVPVSPKAPVTRMLAIIIGSAAAVLLLMLALAAVGSQPSTTSATAPEEIVEPTEAPSAEPSRTAAPSKSPARVSGTNTAVMAALAALPVKGRAAKTGYDRDQFGSAWTDVNRNGCDTRSDILMATLTNIDASGRCTAQSGTLADPYTGTAVTYVRGGKSEVDIDHVVALSNAWQTGAASFPVAKRVALANDPLNLLAVDASTNRQKSDGDAATWLPPNKAFRCTYIARQVAVKTKYRLWVTPPEADAMKRILATCPNAKLPGPGPQPTMASNTGRAPAASPDPATTTVPPVKPAPARKPPGAAVRYDNCTDARAAGVTPIMAGTPLYNANTHLDRNNDGVACQ